MSNTYKCTDCNARIILNPWKPDNVPSDFICSNCCSSNLEPCPSDDTAPAPHESFSTGCIREKFYPKLDSYPIRLDLLFNNPVALRRLGETYGEGAAKYTPNNWKLGFPESVYLSHALEHLRLRADGDKSEDHLAHACWNLMTLMYMEEVKPELLDLSTDKD